MKLRSIVETKDFTSSRGVSFFSIARIFFITRCVYMMSWKVSALSSRVDMSLRKQKGQNKIIISEKSTLKMYQMCAHTSHNNSLCTQGVRLRYQEIQGVILEAEIRRKSKI